MTAEHVDVLIVGAGISGIGAAAHLQDRCPDRTYAILEARQSLGGTWDLFRFPGVRSDSDMLTLGYSFRPWTGTSTLADGASIRAYLQDTARERGLDTKIRYGHKVVAAEWSSAEARWTVTVESDAGSTQLTCAFLYACTGYYRYDEGFRPEFPGERDFAGPVVHPQHWPADLDHTGKRVVVIGSGATAVTVVPAMAAAAAGVTMLQRSPSYIMTLPKQDVILEKLHQRLPDKLATRIGRGKNLALQMVLYQLAQRAPRLMRRLLMAGVRKQLPAGYPVDTHFRPAYDPWDQRLCFVPDGDLFAAISSGKAAMVTDTIDTFTETGIRLGSGTELPADIVVTATGLTLLAIGGMRLSVDGEPVELAEKVAYKGMMLSGVPNFALAIGYTNASWTLKCDLVSEYVCRVLNELARTGARVVTPVPPPPGPREPLLNLESGYIRRGIDRLPRQGPGRPWRLNQNYAQDVLLFRHGPVTDEVEFS
ncbi:MAG TPA: NAD(P)/FAD-dependent oxidoreductase [Mycobacteriales bacterium]|nr:NAD(P)/FAD-dependent oxidoreductase [Mycobacteriales bacterium]